MTRLRAKTGGKAAAWISGLRALGRQTLSDRFNHVCPVSDSVVAIQGQAIRRLNIWVKR